MIKANLFKFFTLSSMCMLTTILNCAEQPGEYPPGKEWREQVREVPKLGVGGAILPALPARVIQEYLVPRTVSVTIVNADPQGEGSYYDVSFEELQSGTIIKSARVHPNIGELTVGPGRLAPQPKGPSQQIVKIPLIPVRIAVSCYCWGNHKLGSFTLSPDDLNNIKQIDIIMDWAKIHFIKPVKGESDKIIQYIRD